MFWFQNDPLYYFLNILRINIYNTQNQHCHCNLLVHTGVVPVNEPSALQLLVRSPAVWLYPSAQVNVTYELKSTEEAGTGVALVTLGTVQVLTEIYKN